MRGAAPSLSQADSALKWGTGHSSVSPQVTCAVVASLPSGLQRSPSSPSGPIWVLRVQCALPLAGGWSGGEWPEQGAGAQRPLQGLMRLDPLAHVHR